MVPAPVPLRSAASPAVREVSPGSFVVELVDARLVVTLDARRSAFVVVTRRGSPLVVGEAGEA